VTGSSAGSTPHAAQAARRVLLCRDIVIDTGPAQLTTAAVPATGRARIPGRICEATVACLTPAGQQTATIKIGNLMSRAMRFCQ
jgi:hypothetical protein